MVNVVLLEPEMPANTGNIGRTCVATGTRLHLIRPLGFQLTDRMIRRAGLDYWPQLDVTVYDDYEDFRQKNPEARIYMATTKSRNLYTEPEYEENCFLMFGRESAGLPEELLAEHPENTIRIPMLGDTRSLNLANSVAVVVYEALRHQDFRGLNLKGDLHRLSWPV